FYQEAFGATIDHLVGDEDIVAQLSAGGGTFWISEESPEHGNFSPETVGGGTVRLLLIADDPQAAIERAVRAGATLTYPATAGPGWLIVRIAAPYGHSWEIAKPLIPWPPRSGPPG